MVVFKRDRTECKASDKKVSQQDTGRFLDLRVKVRKLCFALISYFEALRKLRAN